MKITKKLLLVLLAIFSFIGAYSYADATGMNITLKPGWNVFSTPALLSDIVFSNQGNGILFSKMVNGSWLSITPNVNDVTPLEGFLVRNTNNYDVSMRLSFRNTTPAQDMLSKNVNAGRNFLGITTINNPFYSISPRLYLDFTSNISSNFINSINIGYLAGNGTVPHPEIGEAYGIFLSSNGLYGGSNNRIGKDGELSNTQDYKQIIKATPGSYNIPLLKGTITVDKAVYFRDNGFYLEISGANSYEDVDGYLGGGIIYDMIVKVGSCITHVDSTRYAYQTDASGYKKIYLPIFEYCNLISEGTHDISVLLGINSEYAINFRTGMTITMNSISRMSFDNAWIEGEIHSSTIEISHSNVPNLSIDWNANQVDEINVVPGYGEFSLWSGVFHTSDSGIVANVLLGNLKKTKNDPVQHKMYVDTYVNGVLIDTQLYQSKNIKHEIYIEPNSDTLVEFRGHMMSYYITGSFRPVVMVNRILKNDISYITYNCDYYGYCKEYNGGPYILVGKLFNIDGGKDTIQGCDATEIMNCLLLEGDSYDACIASCTDSCGGNGTYSAELVQAYNYAYQKGLTTMSSIDNACMYGTFTKIALAKLLSKYAVEVMGLIPDTTKECSFSDVSTALDEQYDNGVTLACQLGLIGEGKTQFGPNDLATRAVFGTMLSRILNANSPELTSMNSVIPYYSGHLQFLKNEGIMPQISNPDMVEIRGYIMVMLMRADDSYSLETSCTAEEIINCLSLDEYEFDACMLTCDAEQNESTIHTSSSRKSPISLANVSCIWNENQVTVSRIPTSDIGNIKISLYNESTNNFDIKGIVNATNERTFTFNVNQSTAPIVRFDDTEGLSAYKTYTCHRLSTVGENPCTTEELLQCLVADDYDVCVDSCSGE